YLRIDSASLKFDRQRLVASEALPTASTSLRSEAAGALSEGLREALPAPRRCQTTPRGQPEKPSEAGWEKKGMREGGDLSRACRLMPAPGMRGPRLDPVKSWPGTARRPAGTSPAANRGGCAAAASGRSRRDGSGILAV